MTRILEFQPSDEQTIVARVLVELHQAIDVSFPHARPSARQFSRTVLTNQGETTRIDNVPQPSEDRLPQQAAGEPGGRADVESEISMTPSANFRASGLDAPLQSEHLRTLLGESYASRMLRRALIVLLLSGIGVFLWVTLKDRYFP